MKRILTLVLAFWTQAHGQTYIIDTIAGGGTLATGRAATSYAINRPSSVAMDSSGNLYIAVPVWCQVWVVNSSGTLTQVIGSGTCGFSGDSGPAASAQLNSPDAVAVDSKNNLYIADFSNYRIRRVAGGIISTVAGTGLSGYNGDNLNASQANVDPGCLATDSADNVYFCDGVWIRKLSGGVVSTVAGTGIVGYNGDNIKATSANLNSPFGLAVDSQGGIYVGFGLSASGRSAGRPFEDADHL